MHAEGCGRTLLYSHELVVTTIYHRVSSAAVERDTSLDSGPNRAT